MAPDGRWVVAWQARVDTDGDGVVRASYELDGRGSHPHPPGEFHGDRVSLYLLTAEAPLGEPIDAFVDADPTGRWLVVQRDGAAELRDVVSGDRSVLGRPSHVDFSGAGELLLLHRTEGAAPAIHVRDLATGATRVLDTGSAHIERASWMGGAWIAFLVVVADTNKDGKLDSSVEGPQKRVGVRVLSGEWDASEWRVLRSSDGRPEARPVLVAGSSGLLVRAADQTLVWVAPDGAERAVAPASCGDVEGLLEDGSAVVLACGDPPTAWIYDAEGAHPLDVPLRHRTGEPDRFSLGAPRGRLVSLPGGRVADLEGRILLPRRYLRDRDFVTFGDHILRITRAGRAVWGDLPNGARRIVHFKGGSTAIQGQRGRWVTLRGQTVQLVDLELGRVVGVLPAPALVIRDDGASLLFPEGDVGPLRWVWAR